MFSLKGRIGRKEFLIRMVLLIIASLILNFISSWFWGNSPMAPDHGLHHGGSLAALLVLIAALGVTWCTICAAAARLRDIGRSAWWAILLFVPVLGFIELIVLAIARRKAVSS